MIKPYSTQSSIIFTLLLLLTFSACKKDTPLPQAPPPASGKIDYNALTSETPYNNPLFYNSRGDSTINRAEGSARLFMLKEMDAYMKKAAGTGTEKLSAEKLEGMFANKLGAFSGVYSELDNKVDLRSVTASSKQFFDAENERAYFSTKFDEIELASQSVNQIAQVGWAGKLSTGSTAYLVDTRGIEVGQVIAKSLIGAFQLDYISNILLDKGLKDNNDTAVNNLGYTKLQNNWDVAYGILTSKQIYGSGASAPGVIPATNGGESFLGTYVWEYNRENVKNIHVAFLKGRAAAINKDEAMMKQQALFIRTEFEKTMARAALGYLNKWRSGNDATKAHAIAEGLGFMYSLRFCNLNGGGDAFSDQVLKNLINSPNGFWDITADKIKNAETAIKTQFSID